MGERLILMLAPLAVVIVMSVPVVSVYFLVLLLFLIVVYVVLLALACARSACWKGPRRTLFVCDVRWSIFVLVGKDDDLILVGSSEAEDSRIVFCFDRLR